MLAHMFFFLVAGLSALALLVLAKCARNGMGERSDNGCKWLLGIWGGATYQWVKRWLERLDRIVLKLTSSASHGSGASCRSSAMDWLALPNRSDCPTNRATV